MALSANQAWSGVGPERRRQSVRLLSEYLSTDRSTGGVRDLGIASIGRGRRTGLEVPDDSMGSAGLAGPADTADGRSLRRYRCFHPPGHAKAKDAERRTLRP